MIIKDKNRLVQTINRSVIIYITGCCCFIIVALLSIWLGYYIIRYHDQHNLPFQLTIVSLAGVLLLWEIIKSFRFKTSLPKTFTPITKQEYPALYDIIYEVTTNLNLSPIRKVYICPDAIAAVFIQPQLRNILLEPKRNLVIGLGFLTQMDDEEIRAMLYHEFGHYVQREMKKSISVYTIGQFSRSFISIKEIKQQGDLETQIKIQILFFTYFALWICNRINKAYSQLAKQMEYDADDIAVKYVKASTLQRALLHAAYARYNYEVVQWGIQQLQSHKIQVNNKYLALSYVNNYSHPPRRLISREVIKRIERLGKIEIDTTTATNTVKEFALLFAENIGTTQQICSPQKFAQWLKQGYIIYTNQRLLETSVEIKIHLDKRKHKLPYLDGSYKLLLDNKEIGTGNFIKGYTLIHRTSPGNHKLTAYAPSGIISTPFDFYVEENKSYKIDIDYKVYIKNGIYDVFGEKITLLR